MLWWNPTHSKYKERKILKKETLNGKVLQFTPFCVTVIKYFSLRKYFNWFDFSFQIWLSPLEVLKINTYKYKFTLYAAYDATVTYKIHMCSKVMIYCTICLILTSLFNKYDNRKKIYYIENKINTLFSIIFKMRIRLYKMCLIHHDVIFDFMHCYLRFIIKKYFNTWECTYRFKCDVIFAIKCFSPMIIQLWQRIFFQYSYVNYIFKLEIFCLEILVFNYFKNRQQ